MKFVRRRIRILRRKPTSLSVTQYSNFRNKLHNEIELDAAVNYIITTLSDCVTYFERLSGNFSASSLEGIPGTTSYRAIRPRVCAHVPRARPSARKYEGQ